MSGLHIFDNSYNNIVPIRLTNPKGENNCFLNSIIQALMHLSAFRDDLINIRELYCLGNSCIYCAFQVLFTQSEYDNCIQPDALRNSMASAFSDQARFQLNSMEDAAECYECILDQLHYNLSKDATIEGECDYFACLVHRKFALSIEQQMVASCKCNNNYKSLKLNPFVYYVTSDNIRKAYEEIKDTVKDFDMCQMFGSVLRMAYSYTNQEECRKCSQPVNCISRLINIPSVVAIGVLWTTHKESKPNIRKTFDIIQSTLDISQLFHEMTINIDEKDNRYNLTAIICYHGHHYISYIYKKSLKIWFKCDDISIYNIGNFDDMILSCVEQKFQPLLLIYASQCNIPLPPSSPLTKNNKIKSEAPSRLVSARHRK